MAEKRVLKLSSRGRRFGAALIDMAIPTVATIIFAIAASIFAASSSYYYYDDYYSHGYGSAVGAGITVLIYVILMIAYAIVQIVFYAKSQSIGKAILGMQVVSSKNGKPMGIWWMLLREWIVKPVCGSAWGLGYIWILIDKKNRSWADKILDTYVVDSKPVTQTTVKVKAPAEPVVEEITPVVEPVVEEVAPAAEPVVEEVVEEISPVTEPVVEEVVEEVAPAAEPVVEEVVEEAAEEITE